MGTLANREDPNEMQHWQTVKTQMKCSIMLHFIRVYSVCSDENDFQGQKYVIRCAAVPAHEAYIARTAHPFLCTHFGFKKEIRALSRSIDAIIYTQTADQ